jgi:type IV secretory pathway TrbL component
MSGWKTTTASLGAMVTSLLTLGCCLPLPFLGAAGLAGASVVLSAARPWLLGLSVIMLGVGFFQVYRGMKCRARQSRIALVLLGLAAVLVVFLLFFPQVLAGLLADISSQRQVPVGQSSLFTLTPENFEQLRTAFNVSGDVRVVLLLSPT